MPMIISSACRYGLMNGQNRRIVIAAMSAIMILSITVFVACLVAYKLDSLDYDALMISCYFLTASLSASTLVIGAVLISGDPIEKQYLDYVAEQEEKNRKV